MTNKEAQKVEAMYARYNYKCFVCKDEATQRAHIIGDTKPNKNRYGKAVINSILNWLPVCDTHCNSLVDISNNPVQRDLIAGLIMTGKEETRRKIEDIVKENIIRKVRKNG